MSFNEIPGMLYDDPVISDADKCGIAELSLRRSAELWATYVSDAARHYMLLTETTWPVKIVSGSTPFFHWTDDWNSDSPAEFRNRLQQLEIADDAVVYFFWMREHCVKTTWSIFVRNWINFLYEDEGCIVVAPSFRTSLVISNGYCWVGERKANVEQSNAPKSPG